METDASDFTVAAVLQQYDDQGKLHPISYYSNTLNKAERNYDAPKKELLAVVKAFKNWRHHLAGTTLPVKVISDQANLQYWKTGRNLNRAQARWSLELEQFNYEIYYRPGKMNVLADALTRRTQDNPETRDNLNRILIPPNRFKGEIQINETTIEQISDPIEEEIGDLTLCKEKLILVPDKGDLRKRIMKRYHEGVAYSHPGVKGTEEKIKRKYHWSRLSTDVKEYVAQCSICQRHKTDRKRKEGPLKPLPIPDKPFEWITCDFITGLPASSGYDTIMVIVDRFTKYGIFAPCTQTINARQTAQILLKEVIARHGTPRKLTTDRGPQFTSEVMKRICESFRIEQAMSTAYHPQTDGQTE